MHLKYIFDLQHKCHTLQSKRRQIFSWLDSQIFSWLQTFPAVIKALLTVLKRCAGNGQAKAAEKFLSHAPWNVGNHPFQQIPAIHNYIHTGSGEISTSFKHRHISKLHDVIEYSNSDIYENQVKQVTREKQLLLRKMRCL